jgi:hypothetical protein
LNRYNGGLARKFQKAPFKCPGATSRYFGVCWNENNEKWKASYPRSTKYLGYFRDEDDAAQAYNVEVRRLGGAEQAECSLKNDSLACTLLELTTASYNVTSLLQALACKCNLYRYSSSSRYVI